MRSLRRAALSLSALVGLSAGCAPAQPRHTPAAGPMVTSDDLKDRNESIESVLQKKVPGLVVTRTGDGGIALQIRGVSSFNGGETPPLYVLNGLTFQPGPGGALTDINPYDIESIKVLKGAEAGLYGIQGANGVIVITTKQPGKRSP
jgi:TonB-dependent SusC/RagA subfamily outer membrane receptor